MVYDNVLYDNVGYLLVDFFLHCLVSLCLPFQLWLQLKTNTFLWGVSSGRSPLREFHSFDSFVGGDSAARDQLPTAWTNITYDIYKHQYMYICTDSYRSVYMYVCMRVYIEIPLRETRRVTSFCDLCMSMTVFFFAVYSKSMRNLGETVLNCQIW